MRPLCTRHSPPATRHSPLRRKAAGVTLVEIVIAIFVLTVGVLGGTSARESLTGLADLIVADVGELPMRPEFRRA